MDIKELRDRPTCINCDRTECEHKGTLAWWNVLTVEFVEGLQRLISRTNPRHRKAFKQQYAFLFTTNGRLKPMDEVVKK